jgi:ankyrin repeat protein
MFAFINTPEINANITDNQGQLWTPLMTACAIGNLECVKVLLQYKGIDVNLQNISGATALMRCCIGGHYHCVEYLLQHCQSIIDVSICDYKGKNAFIYACEQGWTDVATLLLQNSNHHRKLLGTSTMESDDIKTSKEHGVYVGDVNSYTSHDKGDTKHSCIVKHIIDINHKDELGCSALYASVESNCIDSVIFLLTNDLTKQHIDINTYDKSGCTVLMKAAKENLIEMMKLLLQSGRDIPLYTSNYHPACASCNDQSDDIIQTSNNTMISSSSSINQSLKRSIGCRGVYPANLHLVDNEDRTCFVHALQRGHEQICELLVTAGAMPWRIFDRNHRNCFHLIAHHEPLKALKDDQVDGDHDKSQKSHVTADDAEASDLEANVFHGNNNTGQAENNGHNKRIDEDNTISICQMLINNLKQNKSTSRYSIAAACETTTSSISNNLALVDDDHDHDDDKWIDEADEEGRTPLHYACLQGKETLIRLFISRFPTMNVNKKDRQDWTPLMLACSVNESDRYVNTVVALCEHTNIDVHVQGVMKQNAAKIASRNGFTKLEEIIIKRGQQSQIKV